MNIKAGRYRNTGLVTAGSTSRFRVVDGTYLPDSNAGTDLAGCYRADHCVRREGKEHVTVSVKTALIILAVVVTICGSVTVSKLLQVNTAQAKVDKILADMEATRRANEALTEQVREIRDLSKIGYSAVTRLNMVASDENNTVVMYVPQVEAFAGTVEKVVVTEAPPAEAEEETDLNENARAGR